MSRIRTIKPDFWSSEQVMSVSMQARLLFIGIWNFADDAGRFRWKPATLKAQILPGDDVTSAQVAKWLDELVSVGLLQRYASHHGALTEDSLRTHAVVREEYGFVTGWHHQNINRPTPSKYPSPEKSLLLSSTCSSLTEDSLRTHGALTAGSSPQGSSPQGSSPPERASAREVGSEQSKLESQPAPAERPQTTSQGLPSSERGESRDGAATAARDGFPSDGWTPEAQRVAFIAAYERAKCTTPAMGGKQVAMFHQQVVRTAELQKRDPSELFGEALRRWLDREHTAIDRKWPYACFQSAWGDLTAPSEKPKAEAPTSGSMPYHETFLEHPMYAEDRRRAKERARRGGEPEALGDVASQLFLGMKKGGSDA